MKFARGTIEYMVIDVTETLGDITSLSGATVVYDIHDSDNVAISTGLTSVVVSNMQIKCLIESENDWEPGDYLLYVTITGLGTEEEPKLGPIVFTVVE